MIANLIIKSYLIKIVTFEFLNRNVTYLPIT